MTLLFKAINRVTSGGGDPSQSDVLLPASELAEELANAIGSTGFTGALITLTPTGAATLGAGWAESPAGTFTHTPGNTATLTIPYAVVTGDPYRFTRTATVADSEVVVSLGGVDFHTVESTGTTTRSVTADDTTGLVFTPSSDFDGSISAIIVQHDARFFSATGKDGGLAVRGSGDVDLTGRLDSNAVVTNEPNISAFFPRIESETTLAGSSDYGDKDIRGFYGKIITEGTVSMDEIEAIEGVIELGAGTLGRRTRAFVARVFGDGAGLSEDASCFWAYAPDPVDLSNAFYEFYGQDLTGVPNGYFLWLDSPGVFRVNGTGVMAYYNPAFATKYTPGEPNFERIVQQWNTNVAEIGVEAGGTGTLRPTRIIGKGALFKSYTTAQRDGLTAPGAGLFIYNSTTNKYNFYNGSAWEAITSA